VNQTTETLKYVGLTLLSETKQDKVRQLSEYDAVDGVVDMTINLLKTQMS